MELLRPSRSAKGSLRPCAFAAQCPLAMFYSGSVPTQRNFENLMEPQVFAALVACFMGATDGLSLGAVLWCGSPTLGKDQRLSDIGVFYGSYRLYYLYDFNVTLRRFCFEVACFSHPLLLCRTLVLKKKKPPSFPRLKNGEVKQITEEPRLSSFGYVHWFAHNPSALEALEGEWYDKLWQGEKLGGETGETVVTSGGQCRQPHGLRDQIWSSRGQQLEEKKTDIEAQK